MPRMHELEWEQPRMHELKNIRAFVAKKRFVHSWQKNIFVHYWIINK